MLRTTTSLTVLGRLNKFYTDGLMSDGGTRADAVGILSFEQGDTLRLDGGDTYYYTAPWDGGKSIREVLTPWPQPLPGMTATTTKLALVQIIRTWLLPRI